MDQSHMMDHGNMNMDHGNMDMDHGMQQEMDNASDIHSMHGASMGIHTMMMMYFHFSREIPHLLFESWNIQSNAELVGAIFFSLGLAIVYEGLKTVKELMTKQTNKYLYLPKSNTVTLNSEMKTLTPHRRPKLWLMRVVLAVLRTIEIGLAYILMLLAMTYNGWLFLSVCIGAGIGFFIFLPFRPADTSSSGDHCG